MKLFLSIFILFIVIGSLIANPVLASSHGFEPVEGSDNFFVPSPNVGSGPAGSQNFGQLVTNIISIGLISIGSLAVIFLIVGGFMYVTSFGKEEQVESAKKIIQFSILGLVITFLAFVIVRIISAVLLEGSGGLF